MLPRAVPGGTSTRSVVVSPFWSLSFPSVSVGVKLLQQAALIGEA
mgnify:CR=1 FL=1